jgi:amphi-Trp domain-containing protein
VGLCESHAYYERPEVSRTATDSEVGSADLALGDGGRSKHRSDRRERGAQRAPRAERVGGSPNGLGGSFSGSCYTKHGQDRGGFDVDTAATADGRCRLTRVYQGCCRGRKRMAKDLDENEMSLEEAAQRLEALAAELRDEDTFDIDIENRTVHLSPPSTIAMEVGVRETSSLLRGARETVTIKMDWKPQS